jgi:hypothetical protein
MYEYICGLKNRFWMFLRNKLADLHSTVEIEPTKDFEELAF